MFYVSDIFIERPHEMEVPNIQTIDLSSFLQANSAMVDVKFIFSSPDSNEVQELPAHKLVLSCASQVFRTQFYGSIPGDQDAIPVTDSSFEAFKIFIDILYNKKVDLKTLTFQLLGEVFYLAEKYHIDTLKKLVTNSVMAKRIDADNLLTAAKVAEENYHMEEFANALYETCSNFVSENPFQVLKMFANLESQEDGESSTSLTRVTARVLSMRHVDRCKNCGHSPCLDGVLLTKDNYVLDARILPEGFENEDPSRIRRILKLDEEKGLVCYSISGQSETISKLLLAQKYKFKCK